MGINRRGSVSIEALLSILMLMVVISVTWGLSIFIYNASMLSTATQLGAQAGLLSFDRGTYRGAATDGSIARARLIASNVFRENTCGMLPDQFSGQRPETGCGGSGSTLIEPERFGIAFLCSAEIDDEVNHPYRPDNCKTPGKAKAVRAQALAGGGIRLPFSSLTGDSNAPRSTTNRSFITSAQAYSFVWEERD